MKLILLYVVAHNHDGKMVMKDALYIGDDTEVAKQAELYRTNLAVPEDMESAHLQAYHFPEETVEKWYNYCYAEDPERN